LLLGSIFSEILNINTLMFASHKKKRPRGAIRGGEAGRLSMAGWQTGLSDAIRQHVLDKYVAPARQKGSRSIVLRSGDIHKALTLSNRLPQVCSAIDARRFEIEAGVRLIDRQGPPVSPGVVWRFELVPIEEPYEVVQ